jgi:phage terminase large subunit-like protein
MKNQKKITSEVLRTLPPAKVKEVLTALGPDKVNELKHSWEFWARKEQMEPEGDWWNVWLINAGRGFGKTRAGAEWVREQVKQGAMRIAVVTRTGNDHEKTVVYGESGLMSVCWEGDKTYAGKKMGKPVWSTTKKTLRWENGATAFFFAAEEPENLRGPQFHAAWCDELAAWKNQQMTWDMLRMAVRLRWKNRNKFCVTTTPQPTKLMRELVALSKEKSLPDGRKIPPTVKVTSGSTYDNSANLAEGFLKDLSSYEGTRLGRQELYAELLEEAQGALWNTDMLDNCSVKHENLPDFNRIVVAIDPAITSNAESDMTGIIVAGIDVNGVSYVLGDYTDRLSPQGWASKAIQLYHQYGADRIVAERNQGGEMVRRTLEVEDETVPIKLVHASRGKYARAEPVSALYERNLVKHVANPPDGASLNELETQMRTYEPLGSIGSPDRLDALVWAITDLSLNGYSKPQLTLVYSSSKGLLNR